MHFVDYLEKSVSVSSFVAPGVVRGPKAILTVTKFADWGTPEYNTTLGVEDFAKSCGKWLKEFH